MFSPAGGSCLFFLSSEAIFNILKRALADSDRGLGSRPIDFSNESLEKLAGAVAGAQVDLNPHQVEAALFQVESAF